jgi:3-dehydroquinate synthetase
MLALIDEKVVNLLYDVVHRTGILPRLDNIDIKKVFEAFRFDKKNISGMLQLVLLEGIGKPVIVSSAEIPRNVLTDALDHLFRQ